MENDQNQQDFETAKKKKEKHIRYWGILWGALLGAGLLYFVTMEVTHELSERKRKEALQEFFSTLYSNFNDRKIYLVIAEMTEDVTWANGMEGGYVHGHDGVREYWERQFKTISSNVTPVTIEEKNGVVRIQVHQVVHDLEGKLLADEMVIHVFVLKEKKIARFDIEK